MRFAAAANAVPVAFHPTSVPWMQLECFISIFFRFSARGTYCPESLQPVAVVTDVANLFFDDKLQHHDLWPLTTTQPYFTFILYYKQILINTFNYSLMLIWYPICLSIFAEVCISSNSNISIYKQYRILLLNSIHVCT